MKYPAIRCEACGYTLNAEGSRYCGACGQPLTDSPAHSILIDEELAEYTVEECAGCGGYKLCMHRFCNHCGRDRRRPQPHMINVDCSGLDWLLIDGTSAAWGRQQLDELFAEMDVRGMLRYGLALRCETMGLNIAAEQAERLCGSQAEQEALCAAMLEAYRLRVAQADAGEFAGQYLKKAVCRVRPMDVFGEEMRVDDAGYEMTWACGGMLGHALRPQLSVIMRIRCEGTRVMADLYTAYTGGVYGYNELNVVYSVEDQKREILQAFAMDGVRRSCAEGLDPFVQAQWQAEAMTKAVEAYAAENA